MLLLGAHLFMMFLTGILQATGAEPIPIVFERLPLDIRSNKFYQRGLAWQFRTEENDEIYEVRSNTPSPTLKNT